MGLGAHGGSRGVRLRGHKGAAGAGVPKGDAQRAAGPVTKETRQAGAGHGGPGPRRTALTSGRPHLPLSEYGESPAA